MSTYIDLPPLEPDTEDHETELWGHNVRDDYVTVKKAQDYARAAVLAERERCARVALLHTTHPDDPANEVWQSAYNHVANEIAAAIRVAQPADKERTS